MLANLEDDKQREKVHLDREKKKETIEETPGAKVHVSGARPQTRRKLNKKKKT